VAYYGLIRKKFSGRKVLLFPSPSRYGDVLSYDATHNKLTAIEVKKNDAGKALFQAIKYLNFAHYVYIAIPNGYNTRLPILTRLGLGLLILHPDHMRVLLRPKNSPYRNPRDTDEVVALLRRKLAASKMVPVRSRVRRRSRVMSPREDKHLYAEQVAKFSGNAFALCLLEQIGKHRFASSAQLIAMNQKVPKTQVYRTCLKLFNADLLAKSDPHGREGVSWMISNPDFEFPAPENTPKGHLTVPSDKLRLKGGN